MRLPGLALSFALPVAIVAAALLAGPVAAETVASETVAIGFAPPVEQHLVYRIEQQRPMDGRENRLIAERELRFARDGSGYILHVTLRRIDADAAPAAADPFLVALSPLRDVEQRFRIDAGGHVTGLDNLDAVWRAAEAGLKKMTQEFGPETTRHRVAQRVLTLFAGLSEAGRLALLAGELRPLLLFAGTALADGAGRGVETMAGSPLGRPVPVKGSVVIVQRAGDMLTVEEKLTGKGVGVDIRYQLSASSGLVREQRRHLNMGVQTMTETRRLFPSEN